MKQLRITVLCLSSGTVPGSGGSQIEGELDKPSVPRWYCIQKTSDYFYYCVDREVFTSVLYHEMLDRQYKVRRHISKRSNKANKIKILLKDWLNNNLLLRNICIWLYIISTNFEVFFLLQQNTSLSFKMTYALQNRLNYGIDLKVQRSGVILVMI